MAIFADKDPGHPRRPLAAVRARETPVPLSPGDIALDVNVDIVGYHLDVVRAADGGDGIHDLIARLPLPGVGPDMGAIVTLESMERSRAVSPAFSASSVSSITLRTSSWVPVPVICFPSNQLTTEQCRPCRGCTQQSAEGDPPVGIGPAARSRLQPTIRKIAARLTEIRRTAKLPGDRDACLGARP